MVIFEHQPLCTHVEVDLTIQFNLSKLRFIAWAPYFIGFLFTLERGRWHITCIYLVILLCELVETVHAILGGVYLFISWSFGMVKTLIRPHLPRFVLLEVAHLIFWGLTTSYCTIIHGVGCLGIYSCGVGWRSINLLLLTPPLHKS
jgi:hypothetical protein